MKNAQIYFSLRKFLAISPAIQKIASDCGCDAVVHLGAKWERLNGRKALNLLLAVFCSLLLLQATYLADQGPNLQNL